MVDRATQIESGERPVVGVNRFVIDETQDTLLRSVSEVRIEPSWDHVEQIRAWRAGRSLPAVAVRLTSSSPRPESRIRT
jgi:methylmalonyl-CoA mutase N-terminal domain/subunit